MQNKILKKLFDNSDDRIYITNHPIFDKINAFTYSSWFYLALAVLTCVFWHFNLAAVSLLFFVLLIAVLLVIQKDITPLVPIILFIMISLKATSNVDGLIKLWWVLIPVFLSIIFHIVYYTKKPVVLGRMFWAHLAITGACLIGGLFSDYMSEFKYNIINTVLITGVPLFVYFIYKNYVVPRKDKDYTIMVAKFFVFLGLAVVIELLLWRMANPTAFERDQVPHLGWAISNTIATVLLFPIPMGFYLFIKEKKFKFIYMLLALLAAFGILITTSRGCFIFGALVLALSFFVTIFCTKGSERIKYLFFIGILVVFALTAMYVVKDKIIYVVQTIFRDKFKSNGRIELYQEALQCFLKFPLFGAGLAYPGVDLRNIDAAHFYMFHNTIFQILGCMGLVGVVAYAYYYFVKIESLLENFKMFNIFVLLAYIGFEGYSMLNTGTFRGILFGIMVVVLTVAVEHNSNLSQHISLKKINFNNITK